MVKTLEAVEQEVAQHGLTHALMCDFFRQIPTNDSTAILPTFEYWVADLVQAGVKVDQYWYGRIVQDYREHGRLTAETLLQADPMPDIRLGVDDPNVY